MTAWAYLWSNENHAKRYIERIEVPPMQAAVDKAEENAIKNPKTIKDVHANFLRKRRHGQGLPVDKKSGRMDKE